jgi:hypothetical protein
MCDLLKFLHLPVNMLLNEWYRFEEHIDCAGVISTLCLSGGHIGVRLIAYDWKLEAKEHRILLLL